LCGAGIFIAPIGLYVLWRRDLSTSGERRFLVLWTIAAYGAALLRQRFAEYLPLNLAILTGYAMWHMVTSWQISKVAHFLLIICMIALIQLPGFPILSAYGRMGEYDPLRGDLEETLTWLRHQTPVPGDPLQPQQKPKYGVLARWDYGGWIESLAMRPTVATSYGTETYGMEDSAAFFMARNEADMLPILQQNQVRYILADNMLGMLPMYARLVNDPHKLIETVVDPNSGNKRDVPSADMYRLVISRLFFADGSEHRLGLMHFQAVEGLRLVYESAGYADTKSFPWEIRKIKVFEFAGSATLTVQSRPGDKIELVQPVVTNRDRHFVYRSSKTAGPDGSARFLVSYPPRDQLTWTGAVGPVTLSSGSLTRTIAVSAADIEAGAVRRPAGEIIVTLAEANLKVSRVGGRLCI
jgi:dolichyl-diphosphooligosaccharide--protein glycosyltransferase